MFRFFFVIAGYDPTYYLENNLNFLVSWHLGKTVLNRDSKIIESVNKQAMGFLDSGAYSNATLGKKVDVDKLIDYINSDENKYSICCQVDTLPMVKGTEYSAEETYKNFIYMLERVKYPEKLGVCFHVGEDYSYVRKYLDTRIDGKKVGYLCLGGCVKSPRSVVNNFFDHTFEEISRSSQPHIRVHAFGVHIKPLLESYPFFSSDSSTHIRLSSSARILSLNSDGRCNFVWIGDKSIGGYCSYGKLESKEKEHLLGQIKEFGSTLDELIADYVKRSHYNAYIIAKSYSDYKCKYKKIKNKLFF